MGAELQDLFKRGGTPWAVKFYKEQILTALVDDLLEKESRGIGSVVCNQVKKALNDTIDGVAEIKDGKWWKKNFSEKLDDFFELYSQWNDATDKIERQSALTQLRKRKNSIFKDFYAYMDTLKKKDNDARLQEFYNLLESELDIHASLNLPFQRLVTKNEKSFPNLKKKLAVFTKRSGGQ